MHCLNAFKFDEILFYFNKVGKINMFFKIFKIIIIWFYQNNKMVFDGSKTLFEYLKLGLSLGLKFKNENALIFKSDCINVESK